MTPTPARTDSSVRSTTCVVPATTPVLTTSVSRDVQWETNRLSSIPVAAASGFPWRCSPLETVSLIIHSSLSPHTLFTSPHTLFTRHHTHSSLVTTHTLHSSPHTLFTLHHTHSSLFTTHTLHSSPHTLFTLHHTHTSLITTHTHHSSPHTLLTRHHTQSVSGSSTALLPVPVKVRFRMSLAPAHLLPLSTARSSCIASRTTTSTVSNQ